MGFDPGDLVNRCRVHRPSDTADAYGDVVQLWPTVAETRVAAIKSSNGGLRDYGPGDQPVEAAKTWGWRRTQIQPRDVLVVLSGPSHGRRYRVVGVFPGVDRTEYVLDSYTGAL